MAQFMNRLGQFGMGMALTGMVVNSALYNGQFFCIFCDIHLTGHKSHLIEFEHYIFQWMVVIGLLYSIDSVA